MRLIFVHGRSQQSREPAAILREWREAWAIGLKAGRLDGTLVTDVDFPFYGDELVRLMGDTEKGLLTSVNARGQISDEELAFKSEVLNEIAAEKGISAAKISTKFRGAAHERGPLNWEWVQAILRALDETPLGGAAVDRFTHDVWTYLKYPAIRNSIDAIVAKSIRQGPCVVVGHSLGSVVAYNVLRAAGESLRCPRYISVGSPLGVRAIQNMLEMPLKMPDGVQDWFNAMDNRDVVALRPLDEKTFPIDPPIRNKTTVRNKTENRHGIIGYLDDPDVAREIFSALT